MTGDGDPHGQAEMADEIARARAELEALERRFAYIGEDRETATQIADAERRLEQLIAEARRRERPADEVVAEQIAERAGHLEQLEERFFYIAEDPKLAAEIADTQREIDALRRTLDLGHLTPSQRLTAEIAAGAAELERLEERFFYIAEDPALAAEIARVQSRVQALKTELQSFA